MFLTSLFFKFVLISQKSDNFSEKEPGSNFSTYFYEFTLRLMKNFWLDKPQLLEIIACLNRKK